MSSILSEILSSLSKKGQDGVRYDLDVPDKTLKRGTCFKKELFKENVPEKFTPQTPGANQYIGRDIADKIKLEPLLMPV